MPDYKHIFFDLDHTLWDFERNSHETLTKLYSDFDLGYLGNVDLSYFLTIFNEVNAWLWDEYNHNRIHRDEIRKKRFQLIFKRLAIPLSDLTDRLSEEYLFKCPQMPHLMPHAQEALAYLKGKYQLHIITNGFKDVQHIKLKSSGIDHYFQEVVTSECTGHKKPDVRIFEYALGKANALPAHSLMVGDNATVDIQGAAQLGIHGVFFNPNDGYSRVKPTYEISSLKELVELF